MILVVVDTNVFIEALFHNEKWCREVLNREYHGEIKIAMNVDTYAELSYIIHAHANLFGSKADKLYKIYGLLGCIIWRTERVDKITDSTLSPDPNDNKFINCAVDSNSSYIITQDGSHLFGLEEGIKTSYNKKIKIMSAYQFVNDMNKIRLKTNVNSRRL